MPRERSVTGSIHVDVAPEGAYAAVSDITRMPEWSPENTRGVVRGPGGPAYVGMTFVGSNKRGSVRWNTRCTVTVADPGRQFAFDVDRYGVGALLVPVSVASWDYTFEPHEGGTLLTETWTDGRHWMPDLVAGTFDPLATRHASIAEFQRGNIARTLRNLKAALEG